MASASEKLSDKVKDAGEAATSAMIPVIERHPLQRLESPSRTVSAVIHILGIANFVGCFRYLVNFPTHINDSTGWHFQYLTIIGLALATITFVLGLLSDIILSPKLFAYKNLFSICGAPMEILISLLYWGISSIDRHLVVPPEIHIEFWTDLMFHLFPALLMFLDLVLLSPPWTIKALPAFGLSSSIAIGYWMWVNYCYSFNGFYPYPIFEILDTPKRAMLFGGSAVTMALMTLVLKWAYGILNGVEVLEVAGKPCMPKDKKKA
ncbi:hypothetical protein EYR41_002861 [Orbilia oligospora]|uniref:Uncharacterized protein n=1 Tax=Orbilia oligospora TaxID=2813651 RepID=A0A7C8KTS3_ORBOL|nr:hypothetical protein TWF751_004753 [Orbilia oligospora]TGJ70843.1 hypothetical protein EYR41_002861 [Orbilia oligospora]